MASFRVEFDMDNAAFAEYPEGEVKEILAKVAAKFEAGHSTGAVMDSNGNRVGYWEAKA